MFACQSCNRHQELAAGSWDARVRARLNSLMAPLHGNKEPILVGGDSNGDVPMLSAFDGTVHSLIIDVGRSPQSQIGKLAAQAREEGNDGRYLLQPNFAPIRGSMDGGGI